MKTFEDYLQQIKLKGADLDYKPDIYMVAMLNDLAEKQSELEEKIKSLELENKFRTEEIKSLKQLEL